MSTGTAQTEVLTQAAALSSSPAADSDVSSGLSFSVPKADEVPDSDVVEVDSSTAEVALAAWLPPVEASVGCVAQMSPHLCLMLTSVK